MSRLLSRAAVRPANGPHWRLGNKEPGRTNAQVNGQIGLGVGVRARRGFEPPTF
jgi:hypothetical protein